MDKNERERVAGMAARVARGWKFSDAEGRKIAEALLFERGEVERLTAARAAKPATVTDEQRERAYRAAQHTTGHESTDLAQLLATGLLSERAEADRCGSLLDAVSGFLAKHTAAGADDHASTLADVARFIAEHRWAK